MDELVKDLERLSSQQNIEIFYLVCRNDDCWEELNQLLKAGDNSMYIWKKVEDGILDNLHNANQHQLDQLQYFKFMFYSDLNNKENLKNEITRRLRDKKLNDLGL
jgi:transcription termination factor NusB